MTEDTLADIELTEKQVNVAVDNGMDWTFWSMTWVYEIELKATGFF